MNMETAPKTQNIQTVPTVQSNGKEWMVDVPEGMFTYLEAIEYLSSIGGRWRLPKASELAELIVRKNRPTINMNSFPGCPATTFWSSTVWEGNLSYRWVVDFYTGDSWGLKSESKNRIRCVRSIV